ncbi:hypothetical protein OAO35_03870 [Euryarchaeota archaeon]|nr:hypothetical protein [Euryarchaeota archaeon]
MDLFQKIIDNNSPSMYTLHTLFLFLLIAFLFVRWKFASIKKFTLSTDSWGDYNIINDIRNNNHFLPKSFPKYEYSQNLYPCLMHWFLSFFKKSRVESIAIYVGTAMDIMHLFLLYYFSYWLFGYFYISLLSSFIFILSIISLPYFSRTFSPCGRAMGEFFVSLSTVSLFLYFKTSAVEYALFSSFVIALTLLGSRFGTQAIAFSFILFSIFESSIFIVVLILGVVFAFLFSGGFYLKILKGHWGGIYYFYNVREKRSIVSGDSDIKKLFIFFRNPFKNYNQLKNNKLINGIITTPQVLVLPATLILIDFPNFSFNESFLLLWSSIMFLVSVFTALNFARCVGPSNRYINYSKFPLSLLLATVVVLHYNVFLLILLTLIIFYLTYRTTKVYNNLKKQSQLDIQENIDRNNEVFSFLNDLPETKILTSPFNLAHELIYKTNHSSIYYEGTLSAKESVQHIRTTLQFPYPDLEASEEEFEFTHILQNEKNVAGFLKSNPEYSYNFKYDSYEKIFSNGLYSVFKR